MSKKFEKSESPLDALKSDAARQRWDLFHRAIAYAKESNNAALENNGVSLVDADAHSAEAENSGPILSVIR
jgi:hypothetical protein